jgi:hypothetical protein
MSQGCCGFLTLLRGVKAVIRRLLDEEAFLRPGTAKMDHYYFLVEKWPITLVYYLYNVSSYLAHMFEEYTELVHLSRLALTGRRQDIHMFVRRLSKRLRASKPEVSAQLDALLAHSPIRESPLRDGENDAVPRDADSRLKLLRPEYPVVLEVEPIWAENVRQPLEQVIAERTNQSALTKEGLLPTKSVLLTGNPGVGKSLAARWLAARLNRTLLTLDLSAVMSSFLGKTGSNLRHVLDYAKSVECILLLDELDAVAKRRDDATEIGELKRLVTVLLQEIDDWPHTGLLVAATNHPDLLDPAVWRRFEMTIQLPMPSNEQIGQLVTTALASRVSNPDLVEVVSLVMAGLSFSDVDRELRRVVRQAVVASEPVEEPLRNFVRSRMSGLTIKKKKLIASCLQSAGFNQRETHEWTGVHRDTIRNMGSGLIET